MNNSLKEKNLAEGSAPVDNMVKGASSFSLQNEGLPIDRGWAWVILLAAWLNVFLTIGIYKIAGIFFVEIQAKFESSSSVTALITSLMNATYSITSLLVNLVGLTYISTRQSVMAGAVLTFLAFFVSSYAKSIEVLIFMQGCVIGLAHGLILAPTYSLMGQFFDKRRGVANCCMITGGSVGALFFSYVINILVEEYALSGMFLLLSGLFLHMTISGALMRPLDSFRNRRVACAQKGDHVIVNKPNDTQQLLNGVKNTNGFEKVIYSDTNLSKKMSPRLLHTVVTRNRSRTVSEMSKSSVLETLSSKINVSSIGRFASSELSVSTSLIDLSGKVLQKQEGTPIKTDSNKTSAGSSCCSLLFSNISSKIDYGILKRKQFLFFLPFACLLCSGASLVQTFIPPLAKEVGCSDKEASFLITLPSIVEVFSVLTWGFIADRGWIKRHKIVSFTMLSMGTVLYFVPFVKTYVGMVVLTVIYGLIGRMYFPMYPVVLVDCFGIANLRSCLGITILLQCICTAVTLPLAGLLFDTYNSYIPSFQMMGTFQVIGGLGVLALPLVGRCEQNQNKKLKHGNNGPDEEKHQFKS